MADLKPTVLWAQRPESIFMTIDLKDVADQVLEITETSIKFSGKSGDKSYAFEFEFFDEINKEEAKINSKRLIELFLPKKTEASWGNVSKSKQAYVKVDWNKWVDSDDEGEDFDTSGMGGMGGMPGMGGMDFSQMMGGMGGLDGMGGMGGDDGDSDDEDLPDLDAPVEDQDDEEGLDDDEAEADAEDTAEMSTDAKEAPAVSATEEAAVLGA